MSVCVVVELEINQLETADENVGHVIVSASDGDGNWKLDAVGGLKCGTCGSRKHGTHACDVQENEVVDQMSPKSSSGRLLKDPMAKGFVGHTI